jgi:hypothetical protein
MRIQLWIACQAAVAFVCLGLTTCIGASADGGDRLLRFHHEQGDVASYNFSIAGRGIRDEKPVEFSAKVKCRVEFQAESDGMQQVQARFLSGTFAATSEGQHKSGSVTPMVTTARISPMGHIASSEVVSGENTSVPFAEMSFSPEDVDFVLDLPAEPVSKGSTWKAEQKNPEEGRLPAVMSVTYTHLGEDVVNGRPCVKIRGVSLTEFSTDDEMSGTGTVIHIQASMGNTTVFLFDYERGLVMSAESTQNLSFVITTGDPTASQSVKKDSIVVKSRSTLTEFAPRKAG